MPKKKAPTKPIKIITLDTETYGLGGALRRIAVFDGEEVTYGYTFKDIEKVILDYKNKEFDVHVYIHNLEFDARKIPEIFSKDKIIWSGTRIINNKLAVIKNQDCTFHDSFKLLPSSLDRLSKDFDVSNAKMDLETEMHKRYPNKYKDKSDFFMNCDVDDPLYLEYLGYDVISLHEILYKLMEIADLTENELVKRMSTASLSKYIFKRGIHGIKFQHEGNIKTDFEMLTDMKSWSLDKPVHKNFSDLKITYRQLESKIRISYCGGRTEVFTPVCSENANYYDVNSLYPYHMLKEFPIGYPEYYNGEICKDVYAKWLKMHLGLGFIRANVYIPKQDIPPLPIKGEKLFFPCGYVIGTWTFNELEYAILNCGVEILDIEEVILFRKTYKVFENFINYFTVLKEKATVEKNSSMRTFSKLMMNTGYGWTGMTRDDKQMLIDISKKENYEPERFNYEVEEYGYANIDSVVITPTIQVQIASYVTSYARIHLLDTLRKCNSDGIVFYCDTDSIVTTATLPEDILSKTKLGLWDVEHKISSGLFLMPKVYVIKDLDNKEIPKFKGISKKKQEELGYKFYLKLYNSLCAGEETKQIVEENRELLRSIAYCIKKDIGLEGSYYMDKQIDLSRKQKRIINYKENVSVAYYMENLEDFKNFTFNPPKRKYKTDGYLLQAENNKRRC